MKDASFSLVKAQWAQGSDSLGQSIIERAKRPSVTCKLTSDNVAGVHLPVFTMTYDPLKDTSVHTLGVAQGGAVLGKARETHLSTLELIIKLASLQTSFVTLDEEIKMTARRVNALEYVVIPRIESILDYIKNEMDEEAREEFFRVKKVVEKKKEKMAKEKAQLEAELGRAVVEMDAKVG